MSAETSLADEWRRCKTTEMWRATGICNALKVQVASLNCIPSNGYIITKSHVTIL